MAWKRKAAKTGGVKRAALNETPDASQPRRRNDKPEHREQAQVIQWAALNALLYPDLVMLHAIPNGLRVGIGQALSAVVEGLKEGHPDLTCASTRRDRLTGRIIPGFVIEMKSQAGSASGMQRRWLDWYYERGWAVCIAKSGEAAIHFIEEFYATTDPLPPVPIPPGEMHGWKVYSPQANGGVKTARPRYRSGVDEAIALDLLKKARR